MGLVQKYITTLLTAVMVLTTSSPTANASDIRIVRYSKEDIQKNSKSNFVKPENLGDTIITKIKEIAVTTTLRQSPNNTALRDLAASTREMTKSDWARKMASLSYDPDNSRSHINESLMRQTLLTQGQKATELTLKREFPILERFRKGMTLNLNFSGNNNLKSQKIRYGLIEKDIIPSSQPIPLAAFGSMNDIDRAYATRAEVIYTIDRLEQSEVRSVFSDSDSSETRFGEKNFNWDRMPKAKFVLKIDGGGQDGSVNDTASSSSPLSLRLKLIQSDGLISSQVIIGNSSIEKTLLTDISLPLPGGFQLSQRIDHRFQISEVVARGTLKDNLNSRINLGYSRATQNIKGEWLFAHDEVNYGLTAESASVASTVGGGSSYGHRFAFALNRHF